MIRTLALLAAALAEFRPYVALHLALQQVLVGEVPVARPEPGIPLMLGS